MTLIITEISWRGIAMAADSTLTFGGKRTQQNAARKLQTIPHLAAGVSYWGYGDLTDRASGKTRRTDDWLDEFVGKDNSTSLADFAQSLSDALNQMLGPGHGQEPRMGFHVAGFAPSKMGSAPSFFHVHDGPSTSLEQRGQAVDPTRFNANNDYPPNLCEVAVQTGRLLTRNGDFQVYAAWDAMMNVLFGLLDQQKTIAFPKDGSLKDREDYLRFQINTIASIYDLSNRLPIIGGTIDTLSISVAGVDDSGIDDSGIVQKPPTGP